LNDLFADGARKVRPQAQELIEKLREICRAFQKLSNPTAWLKFGLFAVGLGQSFAFVLVPPLARDLGLICY